MPWESWWNSLRTFPELLTAWMTAEGCVSTDSFLNQTGLKEIISIKDFEALHNGVAAPDRRLSIVLNMYLPGHAMCPQGTNRSKATRLQGVPDFFYGFRNTAFLWQRTYQSLPLISLSNEAFAEMQTNFIRKLTAEAAVPSTPSQEDKHDNAKAKQYLRILNALVAAGKKQLGKESEGVDEEDISARLIYWAKAQQYPGTVLCQVLASEGLEIAEAEGEEFLRELKLSHRLSPAARCLKFLRQSEGLFQRELGELIGISKDLVSEWERDYSSIYPQYLGKLLRHLPCPPEAAETFILMVNPHITDHVGIQWLQEKISLAYKDKDRWNDISYPALCEDGVWLSAQPEQMQLGLCLKAYRQQRGKKPLDLVLLTGVPSSTISKWEGGVPISSQDLSSVMDALHLTVQQKEALQRLHQDTQPLDIPTSKETVGSRLQFYCKRDGLTIKKFAEKTGFKEGTISEYIRYNMPIKRGDLAILMSHLNMSDEERVELMQARFSPISQSEVTAQSPQRRVGYSLTFFINRSRITMPELVKATTYSAHKIYRWLGDALPSPGELTTVMAALDMTEEERTGLKELLVSVRQEIISRYTINHSRVREKRPPILNRGDEWPTDNEPSHDR